MFGIDISHYQTVNWDELKTNQPKVDFVYVKATQGVGYTDPNFFDHVNSAARVGIPFGFYHFATLNDKNVKEDSAAEAKYFISEIKKTRKSSLPIMLDIESESPKVQLDAYEVSDWIDTFFATLEDAGYMDYVLYSYTPFLNSHLPKNHDLGDIRLWIAAYSSKAAPVLPHGWDHYLIWQYSDKGRVSGITGDVDLNRTKIPLY